MDHRALSDKTYLSLGLLSLLIIRHVINIASYLLVPFLLGWGSIWSGFGV